MENKDQTVLASAKDYTDIAIGGIPEVDLSHLATKDEMNGHIGNTGIHVTPDEKISWNAKAPTASPNFTGIPTVPNPALTTNNTQIATTSFVNSIVNTVAKTAILVYPSTTTPYQNGVYTFYDKFSTLYDSLGEVSGYLITPKNNGYYMLIGKFGVRTNKVQTSGRFDIGIEENSTGTTVSNNRWEQDSNIYTSTLSSVTIIYTEQVDEKIDVTNGRTEYYDFGKSNADMATINEYLALGAECTATVNIKGNKGKSNFRSSMKNSVKLKGTAGTNTGDDFCAYAQKDSGFTINYDKGGHGVAWFDTQFFAFVKHQGYKKLYTIDVNNKKLLDKYTKLGLIHKGYNKIKIIFTVNVKNPRYKITQNYVRTPSIASKNVVMNNVSYDDGSDTLTVNGLKKGTRLNIYNGSGQLYKSTIVSGTSYTITVPREKDLTTEFKSEDATNSKTTDKVIISRIEPNKYESYRLQYKIPKEKVSERTPSADNSDIKTLGTTNASITIFDIFDESQVSIQFPSLIGNKNGLYRIKYNGKEVYKFNVTSSDYTDLGDGDYLYYKEFTNDTQSVNTFKNLQPKSLEDAKKYTITAQIEGKEESLPVPFYVSDSEKDASNIGFQLYVYR